MCKIAVRNDIVKDILKKKNDVRHKTFTITFNQPKSLQQVHPIPLVYTGVGRVYGGLVGGKTYDIFIFSESGHVVHRIQLHKEVMLLSGKEETYRFHIRYFNPGTLTLTHYHVLVMK